MHIRFDCTSREEQTLTRTDTLTHIHRTDMWVGALLVLWAMLKGAPPPGGDDGDSS